ncbi:MAG: hypothetical protein LV480_01885 [Methylacidiphilales bacterium]|nr:hypothetical protein [Candidatus Methylacidiphilales bacterium]
MNQNETQKYGIILKTMSTRKLESLLSNVLREMRQRDSEHFKGDAITASRSLRSLRSSGKLS